jgi:hypothetical protein
LEVELDRGALADSQDLKSAGVRLGAVKIDNANRRTISLYVPDHARPIIDQIIEEYLNGELDAKGAATEEQKESRIYRSHPHGSYRHALDRSETNSS